MRIQFLGVIIMACISHVTNSMQLSPVYTPEQYKTFCAAKAIINHIKYLCSEHAKTKEQGCVYMDFCDHLEPADGQTKQGLVLEYSYAVPHSFYTPWGKWKFRWAFSEFPAGSIRLEADLLKYIKASFLQDRIERISPYKFPQLVISHVGQLEVPAFEGWKEKHEYIEGRTAKALKDAMHQQFVQDDYEGKLIIFSAAK